MGWLCPTCGKRNELWVTECPVCVPGPAHDEEHKHEEEHKEEAVGTAAATTPPAAAEAKAEEAALTEATAPSTAEAAAEDEATALLESPAAALTGEPPRTPQEPAAHAPWFAYVAGVLTLAAGLYIFWPKNQVSLTVVSEPAGALVSVNDKEAGETPVELSGLTRGRVYNVKLHLDGYEMLAESVLARPQEEALSFTLVRSYSPLLDEEVAGELVSQIDASAREALFSHELAGALFAVNPL
ncbi:MAG: PEGA domain-containing protein, partial [Terriglobia bacterium]